MLGDKASAEWLFDSIRTVRKKNCGFVGGTQSLTEIVNSPYCGLLLESCPGRIYLLNHWARGNYVRDAKQHRRWRTTAQLLAGSAISCTHSSGVLIFPTSRTI